MASKSSDNMNRLISGLFLRPTVCGVCEGRAQSSACLTCPIGADPIATEILSFSFSFFNAVGRSTHRALIRGGMASVFMKNSTGHVPKHKGCELHSKS